MDRKIALLSALLAGQLLIIAALTLWRSDSGASDAGPLLSFDRATVDHIEIAEGEQTVELTRGDDGWQLEAADGTPVPADDAKIAGVLDKLVAAGAPWPVATSAASVRRFEVADDNFQRRIRLLAGEETVAELFLGTSPGFRKVHARRAVDDAVYAITFSNFEAPAAADDWLDKGLLQPGASVESIAVSTSGEAADWTLVREGDGWQLAQLAADRITMQEEAGDVVDKVRDLRVLGMATASTEGLKPAFAMTVQDDQGTVTLTFYQPEPDGEYLVTSTRRPGVFRAAMYQVEPLRVGREELIALAPPEPMEGGDAEAAADAG